MIKKKIANEINVVDNIMVMKMKKKTAHINLA